MEIAQVYHDFAVAYSKKKDWLEAVKYQQKALENYRANDFDLEKRAEACITCSEWQVKVPDLDAALVSLAEAEEIYEQTYGLVDKKTCKLKRDIALLLLKANRYNEALQEVQQVEEQERTLYGESSLQIGRTYKLVGTLYILMRKGGEAKAHLQKAMKIFKAKGNSKLVKEVKSKLQMLHQ